MSTTPSRHLRDLACTLPGRVLLPSDDGWDEARRPWQLHVEQRPGAIAYPESAEDVSRVVHVARDAGCRIAVQASGHNASPLRGLDGMVLLKTTRMRGVTIDVASRLARLDAGVRTAEVASAAAPQGLAALTGTSPDVGAVGYTTGGGIGVLSRRFGLCCNHVRAFEVVTADGKLVRADREHEPDLFWALRGGGGSFGVVTAMELELLPLREVYAGTLWYPRERAREVLHTWLELTRAAPPDGLTTMGRLMTFPPIPAVPEAVRGKSFALVHVYHAGDRAQADRLLAPLRALRPLDDTVRPTPTSDLKEVHMDPSQPVPGVGDGVLLAEAPEAAVDALMEEANRAGGPELATVEIRQLEGELARARPESGALASLPAKHVLFAGGFAPKPDLVSSLHRRVEDLKRALEPWTAPSMTMNFADTPRAPASFWTEPVYERLRRIKTAVDPGNLFLANHPVPPA
jgi:FAD/FMN-containing dehydrogenase